MKTMKLDKIEVAIIGLCAFLVIAWSFWLSPLLSSKTKQPAQNQQTLSIQVSQPQTPTTSEPTMSKEGSTSTSPITKTEEKVILPEDFSVKIGEDVTAQMALTKTSAGFKHITLADYKETVKKDSPEVVLQDIRPFVSLINDATHLQSCTQDPLTGAIVATHSPDQAGIAVQEIWTPKKDDVYRFSYRLTYKNTSVNPAVVNRSQISLGAIPAPKTSGGMFSIFTSSGADIADVDAYAVNKSKLRTIDASKSKKGKGIGEEDERYAWLALHNKYFIGYLEAVTTPFTGFQSSILPIGKTDYVQADAIFAPNKMLNPGESVSYEFNAYIGPKDYEQLSHLGEKAVSVLRMDLFFFFHPDWMGWLSRKILISLVWLRGFFPFVWGYGAAIILITVIIKMLFWPLTHHSTVSMHRMQQIQPKMKELQEKYKGNKEVLNAKIMELYREYKVNPFGGCLPILLQMPVFFALFNTLRASIELRHAEFFWVKDLAMPDVIFSIPLGFTDFPICPLAIMMGITMIWQQMMTPTTGDPKQAKMMRMMTFFFVFLLYGMPSGLTLYWTVNQVLSIIQSYITNKKVKQTQLN